MGVCEQDLLFPLRVILIWLNYSFNICLTVTNERICFLNGSPDEVIRSLFYNKNNESLITVSVYGSENFSSLRCRTTRIEYVRYPNFHFYPSYFLLAFLRLLILFAIAIEGTLEEESQMPDFPFLKLSHWNGLDLLSLMM